ncbi:MULTISPECIES: DUF418 domain-containing protein [Lysinibacillus]|jgi:uncharacterized protein|uniref:DUF418 domain-containing protein n=1 Tax=Lysinibacillus TaxID=400634 RepID=UPI0004D386B0|nr:MULTISPECIES: DUF418 domain-containing protein [Lysinibacillus]AJK88802.1 hypothetical protein HR49_17530 [Lysinibacillus fusiformis]KGA82994.1 hypothetical protein KQ41_10855 [Lysinibacillus fusiformis]KHK52761.1 hypothetical protein PI85_12610 [Lysinibacillus sp. A1]MCE4043483.1 DUF418 domain-containing protein [Lysinibacillus fusiformis]MCK1987080.1 DUF418 domain-containing protein [Lysinibacillus fusiformis]
MNPSVTQKERILSLDIIRGLALFGILFINVGAYQVIIEGGPMPDYSGINGVIDSLIDIFIEKKFFSIFSFLFGVGFYIFASRAEARGDKPKRRFARRLVALLIIGIIHIFLFWGSILAIYAVIGFLLLPFYSAKIPTICKWLFTIITLHILAILGQMYIPTSSIMATILGLLGNDAIAIFIMFLSGFLVAKAGWIGHIGAHIQQIKWLLLVTGPFFIGFSLWIWFASQADDQQLQSIIGLGVVPTTYFYLACLFTILENRQIAKIFQPIGRVGQMAFTNYLAQSFIGMAIISIMGLEVVSPSDIVVIASIIFIIQIIFSMIWFKFFSIGPFEKLWRYMTYGKKNVTKQS